jgi:ribosomal protein L11 methyltransferase
VGGRWVEIQIETTAAAAELVAAAVSDLVGGVEVRDAETIFPTGGERVVIVAFATPEARDVVLAAAARALDDARAGGTPTDPVALRERAAHEDEWRDVWKQFFRTQRIGKRFVVGPSWDTGPVPAGGHVVELDPGRAFGTGAHPSTRLALALADELEDARAEVASFLDLGCGSGILSIAAARLWPAARGLAVDLDAEAVACTEENLAKNAVTTVGVRAGSLAALDRAAAAPGGFDVVLANIQADVLEALAPELAAHVAPRGRVILSGLLADQVEAVLAAYAGVGLSLERRADEGEWTALRLARTAGRT